MIQQTIDELRALKRNMIDESCTFKPTNDNIYTLDKAIIACEQLRKARKKAKRWKRKYMTLVADYDEFPEHKDGIRIGNTIFDEWLALSDMELKEINDKVNFCKTTGRK